MDITSPKKVGDHVYVGGATVQPRPGWVLVDVQDLPESPSSLAAVPMASVKAKVARVVRAVRAGKTVLVRCKHGVSRSPTIAKLALKELGKSFGDNTYFPAKAWGQVTGGVKVIKGKAR